jgi:hypothetical protein
MNYNRVDIINIFAKAFPEELPIVPCDITDEDVVKFNRLVETLILFQGRGWEG